MKRIDADKTIGEMLAEVAGGVGKWGSPVEVERRRRIHVAAWAYSYEFDNYSIVSDEHYDREARLIDPTVSTGNEKLDKFFREKFDPDTGMWVHDHPDKKGLKRVVATLKRLKEAH